MQGNVSMISNQIPLNTASVRTGYSKEYSWKDMVIFFLSIGISIVLADIKYHIPYYLHIMVLSCILILVYNIT